MKELRGKNLRDVSWLLFSLFRIKLSAVLLVTTRQMHLPRDDMSKRWVQHCMPRPPQVMAVTHVFNVGHLKHGKRLCAGLLGTPAPHGALPLWKLALWFWRAKIYQVRFNLEPFRDILQVGIHCPAAGHEQTPCWRCGCPTKGMRVSHALFNRDGGRVRAKAPQGSVTARVQEAFGRRART